jgi:monolysocardiolipin acyltransferase
MNIITEKLKQGNWVHLFPEGKISQTGEMGTIKKGVSKIILETNPVVLPLYHEGMEKGEEFGLIYFQFCQKVTS